MTRKTQLIGPSDVQWMTARSSIVHSKLPGLISTSRRCRTRFPGLGHAGPR